MTDFWQGVEFSHMLLREHIGKDAVVIDATLGNGNDTVFLANLVDEEGRVISFDIQKKAVENSRAMLVENNLIHKVKLIEDGHQNLDKYINKEVDGIIFNLGYLPGGDKEITTVRESTITAIEKGLTFLKVGGIIVLVIYTGHPGGEEELDAIIDLAESLDKHIYNALRYNFINQHSSPRVVAIIRRC